MCLQVTELSELSKVALGGDGIETEMTDNFFCRNLVFISHEFHNIDHFLRQRGLYRPFIDHSSMTGSSNCSLRINSTFFYVPYLVATQDCLIASYITGGAILINGSCMK